MDRSTAAKVTLYIAGASPQSSNAVRAVTGLLRRFPSAFDLSVVDVHRNASAAYRDNVLTVPSLVLETPERKLLVSGAFSERSLRTRLGLVT